MPPRAGQPVELWANESSEYLSSPCLYQDYNYNKILEQGIYKTEIQKTVDLHQISNSRKMDWDQIIFNLAVC